VRETKYARELRDAGVKKWRDGSEARIERILVKGTKAEEIRFSWWKNGKMTPRPLDLTEKDLLSLFEDAIAKGTFDASFKAGLKALL
jgi:hypothetical protein